MPNFAIVSLEDAKLQTTSGRQREYLNEYAGYIQQLSHGKAGMLHPREDEKLATIRRRLIVAAKMLNIQLVIKRSGQDIYFWIADKPEVPPRPRRSRRAQQEETPAMGDSEQGEIGDSELD